MRQVGIATIVDKDRLLVQMRENRAHHLDEFLEALRGYHEAAIGQMVAKLEELKGVKLDVDTDVGGFLRFDHSNRPKHFLDAYDDVIEMLTWTNDHNIKIEAHQFRAWVLDKWDWSGEFSASNAAYK